MISSRPAPPFHVRRRTLLQGAGVAVAGSLLGHSAQADGARRITVAFANITEEPGVRLEGTGFTGADVRESFELAARLRPVELLFYDNRRDGARALANVEDAIRKRADIYLHYGWDAEVNAEAGRRLGAAGIPALAISIPIEGAPLYTADNEAAGRIAAEALTRFAEVSWPGEKLQAVIIGPLSDHAGRVDERAAAIADSLKPTVSNVQRIDTGGDAFKAQQQLRSLLASRSARKVLIAALDDATGLAAKTAVEEAGRPSDAAVVSQGCDHSVHGTASEKKPLDPVNRGSFFLGSVAFFLDRYGYDVLPLAEAIAAKKQVPARTTTQHRLITPANVFVVYGPTDMN